MRLPKILAFLIFLAIPCWGQTATFLKQDTATGTAWSEKYGANGYAIPLAQQNVSGATVSLPGSISLWQWAPGATCWYSNASFTINVNITDGKAHQLALWAMDYDKQGRTETVQVNGLTQNVSSFTGGVYLSWLISGNVTFTISRVAGPNAVINGVFLDPAPAVGSHQVMLSWNVVSGSGVSYNVYKNGSLIANVSATTYTDNTVQSGQTYAYTVTSLVNSQESAVSPVTAVTGAGITLVIPSP